MLFRVCSSQFPETILSEDFEWFICFIWKLNRNWTRVLLSAEICVWLFRGMKEQDLESTAAKSIANWLCDMEFLYKGPPWSHGQVQSTCIVSVHVQSCPGHHAHKCSWILKDIKCLAGDGLFGARLFHEIKKCAWGILFLGLTAERQYWYCVLTQGP